jgi:hypothetical protein
MPEVSLMGKLKPYCMTILLSQIKNGCGAPTAIINHQKMTAHYSYDTPKKPCVSTGKILLSVTTIKSCFHSIPYLAGKNYHKLRKIVKIEILNVTLTGLET